GDGLVEVAPEYEGGAITVRLAEFVARRDVGHTFAETEVLEPRRLADVEVIDGMQVVIEAGFGCLLGAKTAAVVEPTLDNEDVESSLGEIGAEHEAVMAGADDDAIIVAVEGVHVSLCRFAVLRFCAPFPAAGRSGKVPDTLRKGEPRESARERRATSSRAVGERAGKILIARLGHPSSPWPPDRRKRGLGRA